MCMCVEYTSVHVDILTHQGTHTTWGPGPWVPLTLEHLFSNDPDGINRASSGGFWLTWGSS